MHCEKNCQQQFFRKRSIIREDMKEAPVHFSAIGGQVRCWHQQQGLKFQLGVLFTGTGSTRIPSSSTTFLSVNEAQ
jgi:hypothetical protein